MANDVKARVVPKSETLENWRKSSYKPKAGEILTVQGKPSFVIIGDGVTAVKELPLVGVGDKFVKQFIDLNELDAYLKDNKNEQFYGFISSFAGAWDSSKDEDVNNEVYDPEIQNDSDGKEFTISDTFFGYFYYGKRKFLDRFDSDTNELDNTNYIYFYDKGIVISVIEKETVGDIYENTSNDGSYFIYTLVNDESIKFDEFIFASRISSLEENLSNEIQRSKQEEKRIENRLDSEITRSTTKDSEHDSLISDLRTDLDQEVTDRQNADKVLQENINNEKTAREEADRQINSSISSLEENLSNEITNIKEALQDVNSVMNFIGVSTTDPQTQSITIDGTIIAAPRVGDVVIYIDKEFVYDGTKWIEIGDTSAERTDIESLQKEIVDIRETYVLESELEERLKEFDFNLDIDYGDTLPETGEEGDIFLLRGEDEDGSDSVTTNPDEIIFSQGTEFLFTKPIGTVTQEDIEDGNGSTTRDASGMSITSFLASLFAEEENPTTPSTSASITSSNIGAKEVGERIAVAYSFSTSAGSYKFGPENGVVFSNYSATFNGETLTTSSGTFKEVQVIDGMSLVITGSCSQSAGNIPVTNFGKEYPDAQIPEKEWTNLSKGTLTGYRAWFCGYKDGTNSLDDPTAITGEQIRALGNSANGSWKSSMSVTKMKQMFFAAPKGKGYKPVIKDASTTAPQTVLGPIVVSVPGANNYTAIDYDVYYVANDEAAAGSATLKITKS